jgi:lipid II:glycine glycyltransferase (peptidoglycan interpeptide bridge formation enzyme)
MITKPILESERNSYNKVVSHPLQSYEWGEFREKEGIKIVRIGCYEDGKLVDGFTLTIHPIPKTRWNIGYLPKGTLPTKEIIKALRKIGKEQRCIFIQLEPNEYYSAENERRLFDLGLQKAAHPLFTKYTFILDITKSEEELLKNLHPKTRYNIRVAQKYNVNVTEKNTDDAFKAYLDITEETTKRQKFYAHSKDYHTLQWHILPHESHSPYNELSSHLLVATYNMKILVTWILFVFKDTLYYPYGASTSEHRETMASTLMMWEAIKFGKTLGLKKFDMWGALGPEPDTLDPWYGFHRFKQGFRPEHIEFIGSYDLILIKPLYLFYKVSDKMRWVYLKIKKQSV